MPAYDFTSHRLYIDAALAPLALLPLDRAKANYLVNVLRLRADAGVLVFNGRDGEWRATLTLEGRRGAHLVAREQVRPQPPAGDLHYIFAPLKHARLDYMAQKAVEMGASRLMPVRTQHTQATRVNLDRLQANAVEAAEQCGVLNLPQVAPERPLREILQDWDAARLLVFCDEEAQVADPIAALRAAGPHVGLSVIIGPEGGFDAAERALLRAVPGVVRLSLGPRILRADTAAVAALALVQATLGDGAANAPGF